MGMDVSVVISLSVIAAPHSRSQLACTPSFLDQEPAQQPDIRTLQAIAIFLECTYARVECSARISSRSWRRQRRSILYT